MICLICAKNSSLYYTIGKNPICPDCASLALSTLAEYGIPGLSVVDENETDVESYLTQSEIIGEEKIDDSTDPDDWFICHYKQTIVKGKNTGTDCNVDAGEELDEDGLYPSGRAYPSNTCDGCRYRDFDRSTFEEVPQNGA